MATIGLFKRSSNGSAIPHTPAGQYCGQVAQYPDSGVVLVNALFSGLVADGVKLAVIFISAAVAQKLITQNMADKAMRII
ncbi:hypothetical protein [Kosakonia pseudosacchari]|uniref:hypothetical protein n=1 Tax=Kosakonia pseudosacchari TaxID=1646340 RepID=UPI00187FFAC5|nr:hypothetical protein [Kosakonia pseudosacchari]QOV63590.1 hypothetical protein IP581_20510 [Kosakonia pseudosacchari]